jgi:pyrroloquinoline quinone biosynthesis protein E
LAKAIGKFRIGFTLNAVVHRQNLERLPEIIALAETLKVNKLEIANVQYYGWAYRNRETLLPTRQQLETSLAIIEEAQERLGNRLRIEFVVPDYYGKYPKACMGGWGKKMMLIDPAGKTMPCHAAGVIPGAEFPSAAEHALCWIWHESEIFQRFRGEDWMQEPCRSCDRRAQDFGGCRCQAMMITGDANATDPACSLSLQRGLITSITEKANHDTSAVTWTYRQNPT